MYHRAKQGHGSKGTNPAKNDLTIVRRLIVDQSYVQEQSKKPIVRGRVLLEFNGEPIICYNTLTLIKGKTGVHKSRIAQLIASILITGDPEKCVGLKFRKCSTVPICVAYVDTERNLNEQFPEAIQKIKVGAGYDPHKEVQHFKEFTMININRGQRLEAIKKVIELAKTQTGEGDHLVIFLDVISDCIKDFNDIVETYGLTDELGKHMNGSNVSFIAVIHENPDASHSTKARGHLGTEAANKASTVIRISKVAQNAERFSITVEKSRSSRLPKPVQVEYNDALEALIVVSEDLSRLDDPSTKIIQYLKTMKDDQILSKDLEGKLDISGSNYDRTIKRIAADATEFDNIVMGMSKIVIKKVGRNNIVVLESIQTEEELMPVDDDFVN